MEPLAPTPRAGRTYRSSRRIRLSDRAPSGRLRFDAIARYLQDVAGDDVDEVGWGAPEHLWVLRHLRIDVVEPVVADDRVELTTWCNGTATVAAGRRMSVAGDRGGRVEADSVWVHLGPDARPARIVDFDVFTEAAGSRVVSPKLELPEPPADGRRTRWPVRVADLDVMGHVNNAAYWAAVEEVLAQSGADLSVPLRSVIGYRHAIDLDDEIDLVEFRGGSRLSIGFVAGETVKAVAWIEPIGSSGAL